MSAAKKYKFKPLPIEYEQNQHHQDWTDWLERQGKIGAWYYNFSTAETWFSPGVFAIYEEEIEKSADGALKYYTEEGREKIKILMTEACSQLKSWDENFEIITASGKRKWLRSIGIPFKNENGDVIVRGTAQDITEHFNRKLQLIENEKIAHQSAKLAQLGKVAASIGHEISNPLAVADGNIRLIKMFLKKLNIHDEKLDNYFEKYNNASQRIKKIIENIGILAYADDTTNDRLDAHKTIDTALGFFTSLNLKNLPEVKVELAANQYSISANEDKIYQVILNLLNNAKDALQDQEQAIIELKTYNEGPHFVIAVSDNGPGVAKEIQDDIFEAFFTTKPKGQGTGIGLDISQKIMQSFGGSIELDRDYISGARFLLKFPIK